MSLINKVLKDLETRRGQAADIGGLRAADSSGARRDWPRWFVALALAVTLGVTLFVVDELMRKRAEVERAAPVADVVPNAPEPAMDVTPDLKPAPTPMDAADSGEPAETGPAQRTAGTEDMAIESAVAAPEPEAETAVLPPVTVPPTREPPVPPSAPGPAPTRAEPQPLERTLRTTSPRQRADDAYAQGVRALTEGRRAEAERQFRAALGHDATLHAARLALTNLLVTNGQIREAELQLQQGLRVAPNAFELADRYARLLLDRGDLGGAIGVLSETPP